MRRHGAREIALRESRHRRQDEHGIGERIRQRRRRELDLNLAPSLKVLEPQAAALEHRREGRRVAAPEAERVTLLCKIDGGGIAAVAAAQDGDAHVSPAIAA